MDRPTLQSHIDLALVRFVERLEELIGAQRYFCLARVREEKRIRPATTILLSSRLTLPLSNHHDERLAYVNCGTRLGVMGQWTFYVSHLRNLRWHKTASRLWLLLCQEQLSLFSDPAVYIRVRHPEAFRKCNECNHGGQIALDDVAYRI